MYEIFLVERKTDQGVKGAINRRKTNQPTKNPYYFLSVF